MMIWLTKFVIIMITIIIHLHRPFVLSHNALFLLNKSNLQNSIMSSIKKSKLYFIIDLIFATELKLCL